MNAATFLCPSCNQILLLTDGLLVIEHQPHIRAPGRGGNNRNIAEPIVAIICGPCTGSILTDRAKVR